MRNDGKCIKISVRNLVEFILRSGDIDNRTGAFDKDSMIIGGRLHRKIQRSMGPHYRSEVTLRHTVHFEDVDISIEGRADGIDEDEDHCVVDEIKGVFRKIELIEEPVPVHLAQAKCYAYIYALQNHMEEIFVQVTYCHLETEETKRLRTLYNFQELSRWFLALVDSYKKWAVYQRQWEKMRNLSIAGVSFPFAYREGQKNLVSSVYRSFLREKTIFIQAPTGVGKTMATVFPAVKALGEGVGDRIFYLTAKTIARTAAWKAFETLREGELKLKVIVLTAKEKICFMEECRCHPGYCPYAKGHYDRVNDAIFELLIREDHMSREMIESQAEKWQVCPFEMSLDVSLWMDAIICDYNYVFDPTVRLKRFFAENEKGQSLFLIDEAHNLVDRGRHMYSASLCKEEILELKRTVRTRFPALEKILGECNRELLTLKRGCTGYALTPPPELLYWKLMKAMSLMELIQKEGTLEEPLREALLNFYFQIRQFMCVYESFDDKYIAYIHLSEDKRFFLHLFCVDPSSQLQGCLDRGKAAVLFSATFLPINYYKQLLSTRQDNYAIYAESVFSPANRKVIIGNDVSSRYTERNGNLYQRYARYISHVVKIRQGNYMVFFPSYRFMEAVESRFHLLKEGLDKGEIRIISQKKHMTEEEREAFLSEFQTEENRSVIGFCVMGGVFSEGIDLTGEKLIGAIIAGAGLPQMGCERELLRDYFEKRDRRGFDYAYLYPGINKVLQAAGRVIRTENDRGVIVLLDDRFMERKYRECFPREWQDIEVCSIDTICGKLQEFWGRRR